MYKVFQFQIAHNIAAAASEYKRRAQYSKVSRLSRSQKYKSTRQQSNCLMKRRKQPLLQEDGQLFTKTMDTHAKHVKAAVESADSDELGQSNKQNNDLSYNSCEHNHHHSHRGHLQRRTLYNGHGKRLNSMECS